MHEHHNADSVMSTMLSVYGWDLFFWEQNRFGMLVPLLCVPFKNLEFNFYLQNLITITCGVLCFPLAHRLIFRERDILLPALCSYGTFILTSSSFFQWGFFSTWSIHSTSLCLALFALLLCEKQELLWFPIALILFSLASWVNASVSVMLMPLFLGLTGVRLISSETRSGKRSLLIEATKGTTIIISGFVISKILERLPPLEYRNTWLHIPDTSVWLPLIKKQLSEFFDTVQPTIWCLFIALTIVVGLFSVKRQRASREAGNWLMVIASTIFFAVITAILFDGRWRYSLSNLVLVHIASVHLAVMGGRHARSWLQNNVKLASGAVLMAVIGVVPVLLKYGVPESQNLTRGLRKDHGEMARQITEAGCTHMAGDYWIVWPTVFLANAAKTDGSDPIWALSHRSTPTMNLWKPTEDQRILVGYYQEDATGPEYAELLGIPLRPINSAPSVKLLAK